MNNSVWLQVAGNAWSYFQYGVGVDRNTGLPDAALGYPYFTDWDLGSYIQAVLDAENISLITPADANQRLNQVLTFLQNRQLTNQSLPYWWYESNNGSVWTQNSQTALNGNTADAGNFLVALRNVELDNPSFTPQVQNITSRTNYPLLFPTVSSLEGSNSVYDYYVAAAFAGFWFCQLFVCGKSDFK